VDLRKEFILKALAQDVPFSEVCAQFSISRKTGYKWLERFHERGFDGLHDMSRRPKRSDRTSSETALEIIRLRQKHPTWGPKKLQKLLSKRLPLETELPSVRTIGRVLERVQLVKKRRRRRPTDQGWMLQAAHKRVVVEAPNDAWTVDFKGWWTTRDGRRCDPLTVRDAFSRYILALRILPRSDTDGVRAVFEELFERHGLPKVIQSDNGAPFAAGRSLAGLTKLSAWWVSLGIDIVRSRPGCPQDNGAHERMHADIRVELQSQAAHSIRAQQKACDDWRVEFNHVRPHEALAMQTPAEIYRPSERRLLRARVGGFPESCTVVTLNRHGSVWLGTQSVFVSTALRNMQVGLETDTDGKIHVWFYHLRIGWFRQGGVGRNVTVQPYPREGNANGGDKQGNSAGDTQALTESGTLPDNAPTWPEGAAEDASGGDTHGDTPGNTVSSTVKRGSESEERDAV
jgi:transposase InsO family protein